MSIPDEEVAQVRAATDLVALISAHTALRQQGRRWVGLCPFHSEKTASFSVNAQDGFYYCFGCHASGDAITFVRATEHLEFADAVRFLAEQAGVVLHETEEATGDRKHRGELLEAMARAVTWYHERLLSAPDAGPARDYLRSRGYGGDTVRRFTLGWAPAGWDTLCGALGLSERVAIDTGLGFVNRAGRLQDAFRARVLFPICDPSGRPVAIGGRVLPGWPPGGETSAGRSEPKYKNSPETAIYAKRRTLYALNWAKHDIVATGEVVVCEGYTDVIGCWDAGIPRAVATCGTALAEEHFKLLHNYGRRIVLAYDADQAGQSATARVYEWERRHDVDLRVAALPGGSDPGDLARRDPEALRAAVAGAVPFLQFRVDRLLGAADLSTAEGRARGADMALGAVAEHPDPLVRDQYVMTVAGTTGLDPDLLRARLAALPATGVPPAHGLRSRRADHASRPDRVDRASGPDRVDRKERVGREDRTEGVGPFPDGSGLSSDRGRFRHESRDAYGPTEATPPRSRRNGLSGAGAGTRPGLEALRLAVHRPDLVADRLEAVLFSDDLQRRAFTVLASADGVRQAVDAADADVADLLRRLAVEEPLLPDDPHADPADAVVSQLVREAARRALSARHLAARGGQVQLAELSAETARVRRWVADLEDPAHGREMADLLVAWLSGGSQEGP